MAAKKTPGLDPKVVDRLLDKLATDNSFRRLFKQDPAAALVQVGLAADVAAATGKCCRVQSLAPKARIAEARSELKAMLTAGLSMHPPSLNL